MCSDLSRYQDTFVAWLQVEQGQRVEDVMACRAEADRIDAGLAVYRNAYVSRLMLSLANDFPALAHTLGDSKFAEAAQQYIATHPSDKPDIRAVGAGFPSWLSEHAGHPYGDLAVVEWAMLRAFSSADAIPATIKDPGWRDPAQWPALQIALVPSLSLLRLHSNAVKVWQQHQHQEPSRLKASGETYAVVWREGLMPRLCVVDRPHYFVLQAIQEQQVLADACEDLRYWLLQDDIPHHVAATIYLGLRLAWFARTGAMKVARNG